MIGRRCFLLRASERVSLKKTYRCCQEIVSLWDDTYKGCLSLAHSFALTGAGASVSPRTGERRERRAAPPGGSNPHLNPSPLGQGERRNKRHGTDNRRTLPVSSY